ncbi:hypothetical protein COT75_02390 [Candidatus Beckwithbacteria bacterium CG10_big_fil_rev_8_21_14_0_10_34_10]|uniref:Resolvase/invertase-type recombinase catalytic domain-containing protein n=1 Tax=Candidatus Beckwithbacteria bacterium CG10_big_fil_rev_8_21_14_0_10_34_10 TaxID=1974495 RepID=A0A2H0W9D5_9BACT|nr:MAG: hypothetical protein COT75_02390 [Candidatus Beckwithbacteria bacterium CG10_big_fil_rev_8_21_14_0_10_34_10]
MENKAVIYTRVSDPSQIENNSLEVQEQSCRKFAQAKGLTIIKIFKEEGKSAKHVNTRPALRDCLNFCSTKKNQVSALVVYKFDRFSRNLEEGLATISLLAKYNIEVLSVIEDVEQNPMGRAIRNIMMTVGQLDNELKGERVKDNMLACFRKGFWPFKCPIGYQRKYQTKEQNKGLPPIKEPNLAPIIERMFHKAKSGIYNKTQLAKIMNGEGFGDYYKSKASHKIVDKILKRTFYYGYMYSPKWNEYSWGEHKPLIDESTWNRAYQAVIMKKKNYTYQDDELYPLKGILRCEKCGGLMTTCPSKGRNGKVFYYECGNRDCRKIRIQAKEVHGQFNQLLKQIQPSSRVIILFNQMVFKEWDKGINQAKKEARVIENRIAELKKELTSIRKAKDDGTYSPKEAKEEARKIRQEIRVSEVEKSDFKVEQYDTEIVREFTKQFLINLQKLWKKLDLPKKQTLQNKIFPNGILCLRDKTIRTVNLSPSFRLIKALATKKGRNVTPQGIEP